MIVAQREQMLGTTIEIKVLEQNAHLFPFCFEELRRIEKTYSRFLDNSELSRLNRNLGLWQEVSDEFIYLLASALEFYKKTDGNFDISLKSVLDNIGYDKEYSFKAKKSSRSHEANLVSDLIKNVQIDEKNKKILLKKEIEFGGFGKGFALDKVRELLESKGVRHYYINAGGDIFARRGKERTGEKGKDQESGQDPWIILLEHPDDETKAIGKIELDNCSLAGSAPNRRKWGKAGEFHHLLNAKTKKPAMDVKAIFVIAKSGIEADAYATAIFTAGFGKGIGLSQHLPVEVLIISSKNKVFQSKGFKVEFFQ
ncbi:FAD:protein FMN transferase [Candidatus Micrarchaeota archaeon]|nr:FAD:protein FMN transferase [Candidatus Micrarchaeota archaeon]